MDIDINEEKDFQSPSPKRRKRSWNSNSSQDLSDTSVGKILSQGTNALTGQWEGQLAGQLLVDLFSMKEKPTDNNPNYYMPCMVVDGTSVRIFL